MTDNTARSAQTSEGAGEITVRYGLVLVIFWIGCLKFTAYEAQGVQAFASHSPLLSWAYGFLDVRDFSRALGLLEIAIAVLIATRPFSARISAVGSFGAIAIFLTTLSFLLTTPRVWQPGYGFPSLSPAPGQFLAKDLVLLGAAIWTAGEALLAVTAGHRIASRMGRLAAASRCSMIQEYEQLKRRINTMRKRLQTILAAAGLLSALAISPAFAGPNQDSKMSDEKMSGKKMSHQEMMDKMDKMTADDKAAMYDKMTEKDKMAAMKMYGHDMSKMSHRKSMEMMSKMSMEDKAGAFDRMPMEKKMSMMQGGSMMHMDSKKMDK